MNDGTHLSPTNLLRLDNRFRLVVSLIAFAIACLLHALGLITALTPFIWIFCAYSIPYGLSWIWIIRRPTETSFLRYGLSLLDFAAITTTVVITGGPQSPFFYLYPVPFLIHALQFDRKLILWDGAWSVICYGGTLWWLRHQTPAHQMDLGIGQMAFLMVIIAVALMTARRFRRNDDSVSRSLSVLQTMVQFLEVINALPPALSQDELQSRILVEVRKVLEPFHVFARLWIANPSWKTLRGLGEHPALRPGSPHHLPMTACPAFALRQPFRYSQVDGEPCSSEQFNYAKHLCLPVINESSCFGVLFLGTFAAHPWDTEETHLFEMLAQSIALTLQRRTLFDKLEEKIGDLNFSFEVGAAALATFGGSTQSIEETTVHILDSVISILKVDRASLMLWDPATQSLQTQWVRGGDFKVQSPLHLAKGEGMAGWALQIGEPYWAEYAMGDPHYLSSAQSIRSLLCVPVFTMDRQPIGVINAVTTGQARAFLPREIEFLISFGRQAALAIENARLHQKSRANIDQLNELSKLKSQFLSLVSHDLRGPLTGIRGFCEVLKQESRGTLAAAQLEVIEHLQRQVDLQERMVDDLLDLARMEKGKLSIHPAPTDLIHLLREEVDKSQSEASERGVTLSLSLNLPPSTLSMVEADGARVRQVIWNLIYNALKFTPEEGRVIVRAGVQEDSVMIEVEDTGVGLAKETQERVFDKFFQVSPGGSISSQGLGLGLAICKEIVAAHHGKIRAQSPGLGHGTTISFTLPLSVTLSKDHPNRLAA